MQPYEAIICINIRAFPESGPPSAQITGIGMQLVRPFPFQYARRQASIIQRSSLLACIDLPIFTDAGLPIFTEFKNLLKQWNYPLMKDVDKIPHISVVHTSEHQFPFQ